MLSPRRRNHALVQRLGTILLALGSPGLTRRIRSVVALFWNGLLIPRAPRRKLLGRVEDVSLGLIVVELAAAQGFALPTDD